MAEQIPLDFEFTTNQTFNNFFSHQEIITHIQQCINGPGEQQIFLWGLPGLGKTHLLQACCHQAQTLNLSSFYFDLLKASTIDPSMMLDGLDECTVVCFDNLEAIAGQVQWEQAFFNFFNRHRERGHKLLLSAHSLPNDLGIQLPDLKTRLNWGLTLKLQPLSDEDTITALTLKARQMGFEITPKIGRFLLTHYHRDAAALWALLEKLDKASLAAKRKLTLPFLKQILNNHD